MMRVGIMGAGGIARKMCGTLKAMQAADRPVEAYAIASRDIDRAVRFAREQGVRRAYGSYEQLLADPAVDLVYIATPHSCHAEEAGVYVTEAIWTRYMPARAMLADLLQTGTIGQPYLLTANLGYEIEQKQRLHDPALAGGALLDVGVYVLNFASMVFGNEIVRMESSVEMMDTGVDRTENITLHYADGRIAMLMATAALCTDRRCVVYGAKGALTVDNVNNPSLISLYTPANSLSPAKTWPVPAQLTGYEYEVEACLRDIGAGKLEACEMPHAETLTILRQMDALRAQWGMRYPFE